LDWLLVISKTPYRISLFGGGTDYPAWFQDHGGSVISFAINKYCYLTVRHLPPFFAHKYRFVYSKIEDCKSIDEIKHPAIKGVLQHLGWNNGIEVHHDGDLPARSGIGSSSSFTVGLLHALRALNGLISSKYDLAQNSLFIEQEIIKEPVGSQDQIIAAYGGFNRIQFHQDGSFNVESLNLTTEKIKFFESNVLLVFTGISRYSSEASTATIANMKNTESHLLKISELADAAHKLIIQVKAPEILFDGIGQMLNESWARKRELAKGVSNEIINSMYAVALKAGAKGGKLLGAGGGGFMMFWAKPEYHAGILSALGPVVHVPIHIDNMGSRIALYQPEGI
jgi:D-glycero-alpha-D-manno-heptose-7-phosphate kinase